jgi:hypothetical protein
VKRDAACGPMRTQSLRGSGVQSLAQFGGDVPIKRRRMLNLRMIARLSNILSA